MGRSSLECKLLYNHYLCHTKIFLINTIFISNFKRPTKTCRCNIEVYFQCVFPNKWETSQNCVAQKFNIWLSKKYQYFCKRNDSPSLIFLKERLALLKRLHKMMTVCDPVFSLAITLGPKTLFQPLIESITVASHPLFHAFPPLLSFLFSSFLSSENNATFFQQQLQTTLRGEKFTSLFRTHNCEKSSFHHAGMCISTDLRMYVTGVKRVKKRIL